MTVIIFAGQVQLKLVCSLARMLCSGFTSFHATAILCLIGHRCTRGTLNPMHDVAKSRVPNRLGRQWSAVMIEQRQTSLLGFVTCQAGCASLLGFMSPKSTGHRNDDTNHDF
jgi:hypothetical protein